jgi:hypothetical protein
MILEQVPAMNECEDIAYSLGFILNRMPKEWLGKQEKELQ